jgi:hypothetical protein
MTTDHSYRAALSVDEAMLELIDDTGTQFCPQAVEAFISAYKKHDGHLPVKENPMEIKAEEIQEAENPVIKTGEKAKDAKLAKIKAVKDSKGAKSLKIKAEKEAKEAKIKAEKDAKAAKIKAENEAREAKNLKIKAGKKAKKVGKAAQERKAAPAKIDKELSKGNVRLAVPITVRNEDVKSFREDLENIAGVKVLMLSHSEEEGHLFLLSLEKPMTLISFIREINQVENVNKKGKDILVTLRDVQE